MIRCYVLERMITIHVVFAVSGLREGVTLQGHFSLAGYKNQPCVESIKTTSMETVSTGVLDKNKEHYLRSNDKAEKWYDVSRHTIAYVKIQRKRWRCTIHYVKPTAQLLFKSRFPKGEPTCRRQVVNPRQQTLQGQSVAKPGTPLQNIQIE